MVRRWIELQFDDPNKKCSFEVLDIKNQDNNFDCGLLLCLLIWQFFQTRDVQDLMKFPLGERVLPPLQVRTCPRNFSPRFGAH
jgi:hypothetical protein